MATVSWQRPGRQGQDTERKTGSRELAMCPWQAAVRQGEPLASAKPDTVGKAQLIGTSPPAAAYILCLKRLIKLNGVPDPNLLKQDPTLLSET